MSAVALSIPSHTAVIPFQASAITSDDDVLDRFIRTLIERINQAFDGLEDSLRREGRLDRFGDSYMLTIQMVNENIKYNNLFILSFIQDEDKGNEIAIKWLNGIGYYPSDEEQVTAENFSVVLEDCLAQIDVLMRDVRSQSAIFMGSNHNYGYGIIDLGSANIRATDLGRRLRL